MTAIMYRVCVLFSVVISVMGNAEDNYKECAPLMEGDKFKMCCKDYDFEGYKAKIEECISIPPSPTNCDRETCIARNRGYLKSDGELDLVLLEREMNAFGDDSVISVLRDKCLFSPDLSEYNPHGYCHLKNMYNCFRVHMSIECTEWDDSDTCNEMKAIVEECKYLY